MRKLVFIAALCSSLTVYAQREDQNTQGAQTEGSAYDPATKSRVRTEGAAGGTKGGMKMEQQNEVRGSASSGSGRPQRSRQGLERDGGGRTHNETSSDREEGRGARGAIR
jgi:hypothetical protein